ncbi:MAG: DUF3847 domain-containing protein [Oscillospiraceae bacterium]|jgi:hypothetical protein|nr:DUF3847 domain-containing protein [Oscillospiraceae bacterium]
MAKTKAERIEGLNAQIQQLQNQKKELQQKQNEDARKARTKRLVERGAILENLIPNAASYTNEQIQTFLIKTIIPDNARKFLDGIAESVTETAAAKPAWSTRIDGTAANVKSEQTARGTE